MRAVTRLTGVSINTVSKLLVDAGEACAAYHDENVRGVESERIQADEIWSFVYAKEKNVGKAKDAPTGAGDAWTWTALYLMDDVQQRITHRVQLTTDGHRAYLDAVEATFGPEIDYAMLVKIYGSGGDDSQRRYSPGECLGARKVIVQGNPDPDNAAILALYFLHYNFCRVHKTLRCTPAMEAGLDTTVRSLGWIVGLIDARAPEPNHPATYRKRRQVSN